jgi:hypothetical protein
MEAKSSDAGATASDGSANPPMRSVQDWEASLPPIAAQSGTHKLRK